MSRYLDPRSDLVFKKIFGQHKHLLMSFLNSLLPLPEDGQIESLEYLPTEQIPTIPVLKRTIVCVKCQDQFGRIFLVEIELEWTSYFMERVLFRQGQAYLRQLEKGDQYEYLQPVYGLGLFCENFDKTSPDFYHYYKRVNVDNPEREIKGLQLVFIEVPKCQTMMRMEKKLGALWLRFMSEIHEKTKAVGVELLSVPEIKEAIELSEQATYTPAELAGYDTYWDTVSAEKTLLADKFAEGKAQGKAEARAESVAEILHKMARVLFKDGVAIGKISDLTGLPEPEIKKLFDDE